MLTRIMIDAFGNTQSHKSMTIYKHRPNSALGQNGNARHAAQMDIDVSELKCKIKLYKC